MGARIARSMGAEGSTGNLQEFPINPANSNSIYFGDLVALSGGYVDEASGRATGADFAVLGIFMGCKFVDADGSFKWERLWNGGAGRTGCVAQVAVPAGSTILIPAVAANNYTAADVGTRKGIVYAAGNAATGRSGITLGAAGATVATGPLIFIRAADIPGENMIECAIVRSQAMPGLNL